MSANIGISAEQPPVPKLSSAEKLYGRFRRWLFNEELRPMSSAYWAERNIVPFDVNIDAEKSPNPESRVTLSSEMDFLGQRQLSLNWALADLDRNNIIS